MKSKESKGRPTPVRLTASEDTFLHEAAKATGMPASEILRRSLRLLRRQYQKNESYGFLMDLAA